MKSVTQGSTPSQTEGMHVIRPKQSLKAKISISIYLYPIGVFLWRTPVSVPAGKKEKDVGILTLFF